MATMLPNSPANDPDLLEGLSQAELHALSVVMLSSEQQDHLSALLGRNRQQTLTPDEEDALGRLLKRIDYLNILKARARLTLQYREFLARTGQLSPQPAASDDAPPQDRIARAIAEVNLERLATGRNMTPAQRIQHAFGLIEEAEQAAVKRLREVWPELSETAARRIYRSGEDDD
jgi:hypothetical protein